MTSHRQIAQLKCPQCGAELVFECWFVIDAEQRPDLLQRCIDDDIHDARCARGHVTRIGAPIFIHDGQSRYAVFSPPADFDEAAQHACRDMVNRVYAEAAKQKRPTAYLNDIRFVARDAFGALLAQISQRSPADDGSVETTTATRMAQIDAPFSDDEMPRRIALIEAALASITRQSDPGTWAWLNERLASSLFRSNAGHRAGNIERAIEATRSAGTVFTRQAAPLRWADQQLNLALLLLEREAGNPHENRVSARAALLDAAKIYPGGSGAAERVQQLLKHVAMPPDGVHQSAAPAKSPVDPPRPPPGPGTASRNAELVDAVASLPEPATPDDYSFAIATMRKFIALPGLSADSRAVAFYRLGLYLFNDRCGEREDNLASAIDAFAIACDGTPQTGLVHLLSRLNRAVCALESKKMPRRAALENAVDDLRVAVASPRLTPEMAEQAWADLGHALFELHRTGVSQARDPMLQALDRAILAGERSGRRRTAGVLLVKAKVLLHFATAAELPGAGQIGDIDVAIDAASQALTMLDEDAPERPHVYCLLGQLSLARCDAESAEKAIDYYRTAQHYPAAQSDAELRIDILRGLRDTYRQRARGERVANLDHAIHLTREILAALPHDVSPSVPARHWISLAEIIADRSHIALEPASVAAIEIRRAIERALELIPAEDGG